MNVAVIIPFRAGDPYREHALTLVDAYYRAEFPTWPVVIAEDGRGGPFQRSRAINQAAHHLDADILVINDADTITPAAQVATAVRLAKADPGLVLASEFYRRLSQEATAAITGWPFTPSEDDFEWGMLGSGSGTLVIRNGDFEEVGGFDERFIGWGYEDLEFGRRCISHWPLRVVPGELWHLWHPRAPGSDGGPPAGPDEERNVELYLVGKDSQ